MAGAAEFHAYIDGADIDSGNAAKMAHTGEGFAVYVTTVVKPGKHTLSVYGKASDGDWTYDGNLRLWVL